MSINAFLKINRSDPSAHLCLRYWLEVFKSYKTYILCDWDNTTSLKTMLIDYPGVEIVSSDRSLVKYCQGLKGAKRNMASANLTGFNYSKGVEAFWMVDADDTMFLTNNFNIINEKLKRAEELCRSQRIDAFSLDFYRNLNNGWTFGLALISTAANWQRIQEVTGDDMASLNFARNIDSAFHVLGLRGILKLRNFVFSGLAFQHICNNYPEMPHGIYIWNKDRLWDSALQPDVIVI